ncbi:MAG: hypothetical protein CL877_06945 [Dehalococcoidales bacterium]|nr:hypothetical protein [Dehalococcoidales bacterium]
MTVSAYGIIVFGLYLLVIIALGLIAARQQNTTEDFWVAGRRFGVGVMIMANMAAIMHGGSILSGVAFAGRFGGIAILPYISFALGVACIYFFFARKLRRSGGFTLPDYMGDRFNSNLLRGWSALVVAVSCIVYLIAQIRGMAFILERLLEIPFFWGLVLGTVLFVAYVALGGLLAVVWTNIAQFLFMWAGLIIIMPAVYEAVGGWTAVMTQVEAVAPGWTNVTGTEWSVGYLFSWYLVWLIAYATRLELITKMYAAKSPSVAARSLPWSILLVMVFLLYGNIYLGGAARLLVWDDITSPDQAFPLMIVQLLGPGLAALALTGIASAAMSTTDSLLLMSGSAVAHDLIRRCFHEPRGIKKDETYYLRVSRYTIIAVGVLAFICSIPDLGMILRIVSFAIAIVGSAFFLPLLIGLTSRKLGTVPTLASSISGVVFASIWIGGTLTGMSWAASLHPIIPGLCAAAVAMIATLPFNQTPPDASIGKFFTRALP